MSIIKKAHDLALSIHKGQKRSNGAPCFSHLEWVAKKVDEYYLILMPMSAQAVWAKHREHVVAASFLHDSMEDHPLVTESFLKENGISQLSIDIVKILTRRSGESYFDYIWRIMESGPASVGARVIKLVDLNHNMSDLKEGSMKDKYRFAEYILTTGFQYRSYSTLLLD